MVIATTATEMKKIMQVYMFTELSRNCGAELERSLIVERVKAGLRNAKAKGKRLGRPQTVLDIARINDLRAKGLS
jgi:DNA invertase Pin-like site-specific DNA recombinase